MRLFLTFLLLVTTSTGILFEDCLEKPLQLVRPIKKGEKLYSNSLDFFFQKALPYTALHTFTDVFLQINLTNPDVYSFYQGANCTEVQNHYDNDNRYFGILKKAAILRSHQLNPFNDTVVGVSTTYPYEVSVVIWKVNYIRLAVFAGAILLFLLAGLLVRNVVFYYTSGCSFGLLASLLLVAFIVWRIAPKKTIGVPILIGGWSVSLYMLHFAWNNVQNIMLEYQKYVLGYFSLVLLISLAVCYKRGPPTDARSHDIAQWTLQLVALLLIYFSSQIVEVSFGTMAFLLFQQFCRRVVFSGISWYISTVKSMWRYYFPKSRRLLTEEEYEELGEKTTREQLALLREYCKKEESKPWRLAGNVRNARRLARFIEGEDEHVTDDEILCHDLTGDILERPDDYYHAGSETPPSYGTRFDDDEDDDGWDEVIVKRGNSRINGSASVRSIRVPRSVASRLLSPYDPMSQSFSAYTTNNYDQPRHRRQGDIGYEPLGARFSVPRQSRRVDNYSPSPSRDSIQEDMDRRRRAMTDVRAVRSKNSRFGAEELARIREALHEKRSNGIQPEVSRQSVSTSSVKSPLSMKNRTLRRRPGVFPRQDSDSDDLDS
ncbi:unnamed protein product [Caenorhabditis bovis]|uniref:Nuclear envelope integral membrane protein 1 n=1 Tax=Caenorhabditis bovis TaxID=2654633 RepID=A0A8S1EKZ9_9PELO|nr:unnamed protein product [Caenorhabditis bovis]